MAGFAGFRGWGWRPRCRRLRSGQLLPEAWGKLVARLEGSCSALEGSCSASDQGAQLCLPLGNFKDSQVLR